jgi:preprotein translocase subunit SecE
VVILTSFAFGLYLGALDLLLDRLVVWVFRAFGAA